MPLQFTQTPVIFYGCNFVKMTLIYIIYPHEFQVMRPAKIEFSTCVDSRQIIKLGKQCFSNLIVLINNIKIPYTPEGFLESRPVNKEKVLTISQALNLIKQRGYIIKDDVGPVT